MIIEFKVTLQIGEYGSLTDIATLRFCMFELHCRVVLRSHSVIFSYYFQLLIRSLTFRAKATRQRLKRERPDEELYSRNVIDLVPHIGSTPTFLISICFQHFLRSTQRLLYTHTRTVVNTVYDFSNLITTLLCQRITESSEIYKCQLIMSPLLSSVLQCIT